MDRLRKLEERLNAATCAPDRLNALNELALALTRLGEA